jgi:hypothetical protein
MNISSRPEMGLKKEAFQGTFVMIAQEGSTDLDETVLFSWGSPWYCLQAWAVFIRELTSS